MLSVRNCASRASSDIPPEAPAKLMGRADIALIGLHSLKSHKTEEEAGTGISNALMSSVRASVEN